MARLLGTWFWRGSSFGTISGGPHYGGGGMSREGRGSNGRLGFETGAVGGGFSKGRDGISLIIRNGTFVHVWSAVLLCFCLFWVAVRSMEVLSLGRGHEPVLFRCLVYELKLSLLRMLLGSVSWVVGVGRWEVCRWQLADVGNPGACQQPRGFYFPPRSTLLEVLSPASRTSLHITKTTTHPFLGSLRPDPHLLSQTGLAIL